MKINYTMEYNKHLKHWVVWKNIEVDRGCTCYSVFSGTRKECQKRLKELKYE